MEHKGSGFVSVGDLPIDVPGVGRTLTARQQAADHGDHVPASDLRAEIATVNGTIAALEVRLVKWMIGIVLTVASLQTAAVVAILRLLG